MSGRPCQQTSNYVAPKPIAMADNIRSSLLLCSASRTIWNWQYYSIYLFLPVCEITEDEDDCVA